MKDEHKKVSQMIYPPERIAQIFNQIFGKVLLDFEVINQQQFDDVGKVQARTIVMAEAMEKDPALRPLVLEAYGKRDFETEALTGQLDLGDVAFIHSSEDIIAKLDSFITDTLKLEDYEQKLTAAQTAVDDAAKNMKSVRADAAPIVALHKGLFLKGAERAKIPEACLMMQFTVRAINRYQQWQKTPAEPLAVQEDVLDAQKVINQNNKLNPGSVAIKDKKYFPDSAWIQRTHGALISLCHLNLRLNGRNPSPPEQAMLEQDLRYIVAAIEHAAGVYESLGKDNLAAQARALRQHFAKDVLHWNERKLKNTTPQSIEKYEEKLGIKYPESGSSGGFLFAIA